MENIAPAPQHIFMSPQAAPQAPNTDLPQAFAQVLAQAFSEALNARQMPLPPNDDLNPYQEKKSLFSKPAQKEDTSLARLFSRISPNEKE